jgi:GPH family glycoside/pentoside/hexuronide:cation symporter
LASAKITSILMSSHRERAIVRRKEMAKESNKANLSALTYIAYGGGNLASNLLITTASMFITYYYTEVVGISIAVAGIILAACRVFDGLTDLFMGAVIDKTRSRYGKARPWLLRMAIPYLAACVFLFSTPGTGGVFDIVYAVVAYILAICVIYTAISVPYNALSARITKNQGQRTLLSVFRTFFGFGGAALIGSVTLNVVKKLGGGRIGWSLTGLVYGLAGMCLYLFTFKVCKELPDDFVTSGKESKEEVKKEKQKVSTKAEILALVKNKYWVLLMLTTLIGFITSGLSGINVYYAKNILGSDKYMSLLTITSMAPMAIGALCLTPLVKKFGARNVMVYGILISIIGVVICVFAPANPTVLAIGLTIKGLGGSALAVTGFAMMGDTVEYSEWKFNVRPDGMAYSAVTFGEKVGSALGTVIVSGIMALTGYVGKAATQSATALFGIKTVFLYVPLILGIVEFILMHFYDLDKKYDQIVADLDARHHSSEKQKA